MEKGPIGEPITIASLESLERKGEMNKGPGREIVRYPRPANTAPTIKHLTINRKA
jgi:hypothetical protein